LLQKLIRREGIGNLLAEGTKRAAEKIGGPAKDCAVYTEKGSAPRGHDHRGRWEEMLDTCVGSTGTLESGQSVEPAELNLPGRFNPVGADDVVKIVSGMLGRRHFEDSLGTCIFTTRTTLKNLCTALSAATGWDYTVDDALRFGRRTACLLRAFNVRSGIGPELEKPSKRYGSMPVDGPVKGVGIEQHWESMVASWYERVGYDRKSGRPKADLLKSLGLENVAKDLWGASA
ncbi:MAG TPA: aldehyde ferredoxin oxidoreductase C-terminal domain-containing protein, partial [bacterium]